MTADHDTTVMPAGPIAGSRPDTFAARAYRASLEHGRLCVGIDPHASLLESWGLADDLAGLRAFTQTCTEAFAGYAALVKPQVAFFERFGARGLLVLEEAVAELRQHGCLVLADAKRGDIGSTMAGYAQAWLAESSPLAADAVTVSPYLGVGALDPVFRLAEEQGKGVFVLSATSNPEGRSLQASRDKKGTSVAQQVVDEIAARNAQAFPDAPFGSFGVVIGATVGQPPQLGALRGPVLLPGVGAQGATAQDANRLTGQMTPVSFASVSRSVLSAGPNVAELRKALKNAAADLPGIPGYDFEG